MHGVYRGGYGEIGFIHNLLLTQCNVIRTFNVCSNRVETGDFVGISRVAPEDVVFWVNTDSRVSQILLFFSLKSTKRG